MQKVNILGTEYTIETQSSDENPKMKENVGICEQYSKKIVISDFKDATDDVMCIENLDDFRKSVLRHEIIHAFFGESGLRSLSDYAENEELVDWIAIQSPKIFKVFQELEVL